MTATEFALTSVPGSPPELMTAAAIAAASSIRPPPTIKSPPLLSRLLALARSTSDGRGGASSDGSWARIAS